MKIKADINTDKGILEATATYKTKNQNYFGVQEELCLTQKLDCVFRIDGKIENPEFNLSLEAVHAAGFQGIREIYWQIPEKEGSLDRKRSGVNSPRDYKDHPKLGISNGCGVDAIASFHKSPQKHRDEEFYLAIRKRFGIKHQYHSNFQSYYS